MRRRSFLGFRGLWGSGLVRRGAVRGEPAGGAGLADEAGIGRDPRLAGSSRGSAPRRWARRPCGSYEGALRPSRPDSDGWCSDGRGSGARGTAGRGIARVLRHRQPGHPTRSAIVRSVAGGSELSGPVPTLARQADRPPSGRPARTRPGPGLSMTGRSVTVWSDPGESPTDESDAVLSPGPACPGFRYDDMTADRSPSGQTRRDSRRMASHRARHHPTGRSICWHRPIRPCRSKRADGRIRSRRRIGLSSVPSMAVTAPGPAATGR